MMKLSEVPASLVFDESFQ